MKEIPLTRGLVALVDDDDYELLSRHKWCASDKGYATRGRNKSDPPGMPKVVYMHRLLMDLKRGDKRLVDHIDGNKANNQRSNLRFCTASENHRNVGANRNNKAGGLKGVYFAEKTGVWKAQIGFMYRRIGLGSFDAAEEAHAAYCEAAKRLHGEFANFGAPSNLKAEAA